MSCSPASLRIHPWRWMLALLTLGVVLAGLPLSAASAAADGIIKGTVTFHEAAPDRTLEIYREVADDTWAPDSSLSVPISATTNQYVAHVPAGEPVKLRVSFGASQYGYWYGDVFSSDVAPTVTAAAGQTVKAVNLSVPEPVSYSGRLVDRAGNPVAGSVTPTVNTNGGSQAIVPAPIPVDTSGDFQVFLPARADGVYEGGVLGSSQDVWSWLGGGYEFEPNYYLNPHPGESWTDQVIELPLGQASVSPDQGSSTPKAALRATRTPVVHGAVRKGHVLRSTAGTYNKRPTAVRFQWLRNGRVIGGATHRAYRLRKADVRKHIRVRVTAYSGASKVRATSARTAIVKGR